MRMARIHPQIDKQQVRARRRRARSLRYRSRLCAAESTWTVLALDHVDPDPLGLACEPTTRHLASTRQLEQSAAQRRVPSQDGEQERAGAASNVEQPAMPRKLVIGRQ